MATAIKIITAGLVHKRIMCQIPDKDTRSKTRGPRINCTPPAQVFYNLKHSWRELELWISANFGLKDFVVTFTYANEFLPPNKDAAENGPMRRFIDRMRRARRKRGEEFKYIYVTEGLHGRSKNIIFKDDGELEDKRIHHHMIINYTGPGCIDEIRSLWDGAGYVKIEPLDVHYYEALAQYLTKEAREFGREKPGKRSWKRSMNLIKYTVEYMEIPVNGINWGAPPPGAVDYTTFHEKNPYGFADCIGDRYLLFPEADIPVYSYTQRIKKRKPPYN